MSHNAINHTSGLLLLHVIVCKCLFQRSGYETILGISDGLLAIFIHHVINTLRFFITQSQNFISIGKSLHKKFYILIVLQQFNGQKTSRILVPDLLVDTNHFFHSLNTAFQFRPMIDMNMAEKTPRPNMFFFTMTTKFMVGNISFMPIPQILQNLRTDFLLLLSQKITTLVNTDNHMKKFIDAFSFTTDSRHHWYTKQLAQLKIIQLIATCLEFIIHVQSDNHPHIHIDKLSGEIKITLQIRSVYHVDYYIGSFINDVLTYIYFFRSIG